MRKENGVDLGFLPVVFCSSVRIAPTVRIGVMSFCPNEKGMLSGTGKSFDARRISRIRRAYKIPSYYHHLRQRGLVTMGEICKKYHVERWIVTKWRKTGQIQAHLYDDAGRFLYHPEVKNYTKAIGGAV